MKIARTYRTQITSIIAMLALLVNVCVCAKASDHPSTIDPKPHAMMSHAEHNHDMHAAETSHQTHACCQEEAKSSCCHKTNYLSSQTQTYSTDVDFVAILPDNPAILTTKWLSDSHQFDPIQFAVNSPPIFLLNCVFLN